MRTIIFRGKRLDNGEWITGSFLPINDSAYIREGEWGDLEDIDFGFGFKEVDIATVGQYTGMNDRNGKEIYEGDIIGFSKGARIAALNYHVKWIRGGFWLTDGGYGDKLEPQLRDIQSFAESNGYITLIIGNIHDNPELLEENA